MNANLIPHTFKDATITQKRSDGYIFATAMCKAAGKFFKDYYRLNSTKGFLSALSADMEVPIARENPWGRNLPSEQNQWLIVQVKGGTPELQGTWVHPKVAIHLAHWLSPEFAVWCTNIIHDWMTGALEPKPSVALPDFTNPAEAARAWADQHERADDAEAALIEAQPKIDGYNALLDAKGAVNLRSAMRDIGARPHKAIEELKSKVLFYEDGVLQPRAYYRDAGYFIVQLREDPSGKMRSQTLVTPKGVAWLKTRLPHFVFLEGSA
jgi:phage antirepressor YoqD-like protein